MFGTAFVVVVVLEAPDNLSPWTYGDVVRCAVAVLSRLQGPTVRRSGSRACRKLRSLSGSPHLGSDSQRVPIDLPKAPTQCDWSVGSGLLNRGVHGVDDRGDCPEFG
jgi:hypothetical protein